MANRSKQDECHGSLGQDLVFAINGRRMSLARVDPSTTLNEFIRFHTPFKGTKLACGEGGCGACVVLISRYDIHTNSVQECTVNSCLVLLCSLHCCAITTTEGLGSTLVPNGLHSVQKRLAGFHGSQCGFCTPGMTLSLYSTLRHALDGKRKTVGSANGDAENYKEEGEEKGAGKRRAESGGEGEGESEALSFIPGLTASTAEAAIGGNLCRCTGYRPILDACKSFAEMDIEDVGKLGLNSFWGLNENSPKDLGLFPPYEPSKDPSFPTFLIEEIKLREKRNVECGFQENPLEIEWIEKGEEREVKRTWLAPLKLETLLSFVSANVDKDVRLVGGNTMAGIYKDEQSSIFVSLQNIKELKAIETSSDGLKIGAAVTLSELIGVLEEKKNVHLYSVLADSLKKVANRHVRNFASIGGNLVMTQRFNFGSDISTLLLGIGAVLTKVSHQKKETILSMEEFLAEDGLQKEEVLVSIFIPSEVFYEENKGCRVKQKVIFWSNRAAVRPNGNAHAWVNAAFLAVLGPNGELKESRSNNSNNPGSCIDVVHRNPKIKKIQLAVGAFGGNYPIRAHRVEAFLSEKELTHATILESVNILKDDMILPPGTSKAAYRKSVAVSFLFKFLSELREGMSDRNTCEGISPANGNLPRGLSLKNADSLEETESELSPENKYLTGGSQKFSFSYENFPVSEALPRKAAELQTSGEAVYVDDIPSPENCLYAAIVGSSVALAEIEGIDFNPALASPGVIACIDSRDIPEGGKNIGSINPLGSPGPLFAEGIVEFVGDILGVVVAESQKQARMAAKKVKVFYNTAKTGPPIVGINAAEIRESFFDMPPFINSLMPSRGNFEEAFASAKMKIEGGEVFSNSQQHFYMEPLTSLVVPDEDRTFLVYCSTQSPDEVQKVISKVMGVPQNSIRVVTRRLGGSFGAKLNKVGQVASLCALAAYKLSRPVRMTLDRNTDMGFVGGRHAAKSVYNVGFSEKGRISALRVRTILDGGCSLELSPIIAFAFSKSLIQYDFGAFDFGVKICKTNVPTRTTMRGPGEVQGSFLAETIIEHVSSYLKIPSNLIREINFHSVDSLESYFPGILGAKTENFTLPGVWEKLKISSDLQKRTDEVTEFNEKHVWKKRGISATPLQYKVFLSSKPSRVGIFLDGSISVEQPGTEMGQGLWIKVQQTVVYVLNTLWDKEKEREKEGEGKGEEKLSGKKQEVIEKMPNVSRKVSEKKQNFVSLSMVRIMDQDSISIPNGGVTSASSTSETCCESVKIACEVLVSRLRPIKEKLEEEYLKKGEKKEPNWEEIVQTAKKKGVDLSSQGLYSNIDSDGKMKSYFNFGAAVSEVEIDLLTGSTVVLRSDILYDCGKSLNPAVDIGQVEGAFVMGMGFYLTEEVEVDSQGNLVTDGTWLYKPPTSDTIPRQFNIELLQDAPNTRGFLSSKASGEPPLLLSVSVLTATRMAITAARTDSRTRNGSLDGGDSVEDSFSFFQLDAPASMERVKTLCGLNTVEQFLKNAAKEELRKS